MMKPHTIPHSLINGLSKGCLLALGLVMFNSPPLFASNVLSSPLQLVQATQTDSPFADGIYLYGQSPVTEQIGQEYIVFQVQQGKVIGAVYLPRSEFSCFWGTFNAQQMRVSIVDPYDNARYNHTIALSHSSSVASGSNVSPEVGLEGYYPLTAISDNDQRILQTCLEKVP